MRAFCDRSANAVRDFSLDVNPEHVIGATVVGQSSKEKRSGSDCLLHVAEHFGRFVDLLRASAKNSVNVKIGNLTLSMEKSSDELKMVAENVLEFADDSPKSFHVLRVQTQLSF